MPEPPSIKILALETSTRTPSVALMEGDAVREEAELGPGQSTAAALIPLVDSLLARQQWSPASIDLIGASIGPGSFTGLRVGLTLAKTWAFASGSALVGVSTFAVLAEQAGDLLRVAPLIPAQRGQVFATVMERDPEGAWRATVEPNWYDPKEWVSTLATGLPITGPGVKLCHQTNPRELVATDEATWEPRAATVGKLALASFRRGVTDEPMRLTPIYIRPSAAEEKRRARDQQRS